MEILLWIPRNVMIKTSPSSPTMRINVMILILPLYSARRYRLPVEDRLDI